MPLSVDPDDHIPAMPHGSTQVNFLVLVTTLVGFYMAAGAAPQVSFDWKLLVAALVGTTHRSTVPPDGRSEISSVPPRAAARSARPSRPDPR